MSRLIFIVLKKKKTYKDNGPTHHLSSPLSWIWIQNWHLATLGHIHLLSSLTRPKPLKNQPKSTRATKSSKLVLQWRRRNKRVTTNQRRESKTQMLRQIHIAHFLKDRSLSAQNLKTSKKRSLSSHLRSRIWANWSPNLVKRRTPLYQKESVGYMQRLFLF